MKKSSHPSAPAYLFYGDKVEEIQSARDRVLDDLLGPEERNENLASYVPESNRFGVELAKIFPEIAAEMETMSFIPEAKKVAVVVNPIELYGGSGGARGKRAAKSPRAKSPATGDDEDDENSDLSDCLKWIEKVLPQTGHHLIFLAYEDEAEGRDINEAHPLIQTLLQIGGRTQKFRGDKAFFRIEDAILRRDAMTCFEAIGQLWKGDKGEMSAYGATVRCLRFMLQAGIGREKRAANDPEKLALYFPSAGNLSLYKAKPFVQNKYASQSQAYRTADLLRAYERLLDVYRAMRPRMGEIYVADARSLLDQVLAELFATPPVARR